MYYKKIKHVNNFETFKMSKIYLKFYKYLLNAEIVN